MTLDALIRQRYSSPEWAVFSEVSNATGWSAKRRADAIALGIWPSRGNLILGFEFKTDRRDWLREKKDPAKADVIAAHCDQWWLVTSAPEIDKIEELPEPWGLMVATQNHQKLRVVKEAVPFPDRDRRVMSRSFAAAMLRKIGETTVGKAEVEQVVQKRVAEIVAQNREGRELKWATERADRLQKALDTFREITGVDLTNGWQGTAKISAAVKAVLAVSDKRAILERAASQLDTAASEIRKGLAVWPTDPEIRL